MNFKPMLVKPERKMSEENTLNTLKQGEFGILSLNCTENGYPYGIPINYVYFDNNLYFHCGKIGQKLEIIEKNNKACFTMTADVKVLPEKQSTIYKSVIAFGKCFIVENDEKEALLLRFGHHFAPKTPQIVSENVKKHSIFANIIKFEIEYISGKQRTE